VGRFKVGLASLNADGWRAWALLALCLMLVIPATLGPATVDALRYERTAIAAGEWWRLLTAHWVHLSLEHALLNAAGLALLWVLVAREYTGLRWLLIVLASMVAIDAGLWFRDADVAWYVGASGVLHGVMAAGALGRVRRGERDGWILGAFLVLKLCYEQLAGPMPMSAGLGRVIVNAHLYGAAGGLAAGLLAIIPVSHRMKVS
jgi:rhomboid family GlyGly-CTERM serine protease